MPRHHVFALSLLARRCTLAVWMDGSHSAPQHGLFWSAGPAQPQGLTATAQGLPPGHAATAHGGTTLLPQATAQPVPQPMATPLTAATPMMATAPGSATTAPPPPAVAAMATLPAAVQSMLSAALQNPGDSNNALSMLMQQQQQGGHAAPAAVAAAAAPLARPPRPVINAAQPLSRPPMGAAPMLPHTGGGAQPLQAPGAAVASAPVVNVPLQMAPGPPGAALPFMPMDAGTAFAAEALPLAPPPESAAMLQLMQPQMAAMAAQMPPGQLPGSAPHAAMAPFAMPLPGAAPAGALPGQLPHAMYGTAAPPGAFHLPTHGAHGGPAGSQPQGPPGGP